MKINSLLLIDNLIRETNIHIHKSKVLLDLDENILQKRIENQWTILECCEHLNQYFDFYLPEISKKILNSNTSSNVHYKSGLIGNYFAESMLPKKGAKKMKSPKDKNPFGKSLSKKSIEKLITNLNLFISLLEKSKSKNLEKVKIEISISKFIKLKLGDTFRFIVNHNERHFLQMEKLIL